MPLGNSLDCILFHNLNIDVCDELIHWNGDSQLGVMLPHQETASNVGDISACQDWGGDSAPRGHREMSGDFCGCHTVGGFRRQLDRGCSTPHSAQAGPAQRMTCTSVQAQRGLTGLVCLLCSTVSSPEPGPRWALPKDVRAEGMRVPCSASLPGRRSWDTLPPCGRSWNRGLRSPVQGVQPALPAWPHPGEGLDGALPTSTFRQDGSILTRCCPTSSPPVSTEPLRGCQGNCGHASFISSHFHQFQCNNITV